MTTARPRCVVHKFGGSSLADAARFRRVADIVAARPEAQRVIVVSAMGGVTDTLVRAVHLSAAGDDAARDAIDAVRTRHRETIAELLSPQVAKRIADALERDLGDIDD